MSKLLGYPWVNLVSAEFSKSQMIFQKGGQLLITDNGIVSKGRWELLSKADSMLIEINGNSRIYYHAFIDDNIMIFKLVSTESNYLVLINEAKFNEADLESYFKSIISRLVNPAD